MKIFQLELTNMCNARCGFCLRTHKMTRPVGIMSQDTYTRCLELMAQEEDPTVNLHNWGESLLHPRVVSFVRQATEAGIRTAISTNGILLDQSLVYKLEDAGLEILRISWDAAQAAYEYETRGRMQVKAHAVWSDSKAPPDVYRKGIDNCAGQLAGVPRRELVACSFLHERWHVVLWDGTVVPCCLDVNGDAVLGNVHSWQGEPGWSKIWWSLCERCDGYVDGDEIGL